MKDERLKILGANIKRLRNEKGMTMQQLGDLCDFDRANMSRLESGSENPTLETLLKITDALEVPLSELLFGINKSSKK